MGKSFRFPVEADRLAEQFAGALSERERTELGQMLAERDRNLEDYVSRSVMPSCVLTRSTDQIIAGAIETAVTFDVVLWDPRKMRSGNSIVIPETGLWHISGGAYWAEFNFDWGVGGHRTIHLRRNRGGVLTTILDDHVCAGSPEGPPPPNSNTTVAGPGHYPSTDYPLNKGDILTMEVLHQVFPGQPEAQRYLRARAYSPVFSARLVAR